MALLSKGYQVEILSKIPRRELVGLSRQVPEKGSSGGRQE
jgi:hypothetical protein